MSVKTELKGASTIAKYQNEVVQLPEAPQDAQRTGDRTSPLHHISRYSRRHWGGELPSD